MFSLAGCKGNSNQDRLPAEKVRELIARSGLSIPDGSKVIASGEGRKICWFIIRAPVPVSMPAVDCEEMKESIVEVLKTFVTDEDLSSPKNGSFCEWKTKEGTCRGSGLLTSNCYYLLVEVF